MKFGRILALCAASVLVAIAAPRPGHAVGIDVTAEGFVAGSVFVQPSDAAVTVSVIGPIVLIFADAFSPPPVQVGIENAGGPFTLTVVGPDLFTDLIPQIGASDVPTDIASFISDSLIEFIFANVTGEGAYSGVSSFVLASVAPVGGATFTDSNGFGAVTLTNLSIIPVPAMGPLALVLVCAGAAALRARSRRRA